MTTRPASTTDDEPDLQTMPVAAVLEALSATTDGLTQAEADKRLAHYGPNEIEEHTTNPLLKFLTYFWGPIPWMIEIAVILSAAVGHWADFFIILILLLSNATVGFWEERQAGNAIDALKANLAVTARVRRDEKWTTPPARELVPGDVIRLRLGDIVPADARLLAGDPVEVDQSALTGESLPATREDRRRRLLRLDHPPGRDRRARLRHRREHLLRQDRRARSGCPHRQPLPEGRPEDRQLPDHARGRAGLPDHHRRRHPR